MAGVTLDTGALIALERGRRRMVAQLASWHRTRVTVTVPTVVLAEWWRRPHGPLARLLDGFDIEWVSEAIAKTAGEALAELRLGREHTIDAIVMASAAQRGDAVYTSDFDDLSRIGTQFPGVRIFGA
jgi:predicted nucleic acid-binding protein